MHSNFPKCSSNCRFWLNCVLYLLSCPHAFQSACATVRTTTFQLPLTFVLIYVLPAFTWLSDEANCLCDQSRKAVALWQTGSQYCGNPLRDKCRPLTLQRLQLPPEKKKGQTVAGGPLSSQPSNLHAPLLGCSCVRSAGLYCNVNPTNPDVFGFFGRLVVPWGEGKTVQEVWMHSYPLRILVMLIRFCLCIHPKQGHVSRTCKDARTLQVFLNKCWSGSKTWRILLRLRVKTSLNVVTDIFTGMRIGRERDLLGCAACTCCAKRQQFVQWFHFLWLWEAKEGGGKKTKMMFFLFEQIRLEPRALFSVAC